MTDNSTKDIVQTINFCLIYFAVLTVKLSQLEKGWLGYAHLHQGL